jgi:DNA-binding transcriptional ArsR family regulator
MSLHGDRIALMLAAGPASAGELGARLGVSQPTLSRALNDMSGQLVRIRKGRSFSYALRDGGRGFSDIAVYRVDPQGLVSQLGTLIPVRDAGYVMRETDGSTLHSEGLPWWILDMRPQGFMGRAYAGRHAVHLGLPSSLQEWSDSHAVRALLAHGHDVTGNLLLGDLARERFLETSAYVPVASEDRPKMYAQLSQASIGDDQTWSSAGGEQPKFTAYAETRFGLRHVIVKFSVLDDNPVSQRWRDLLLSEHHALEALLSAGVAASRTSVIDSAGQRFLEVERFDRVGERGRQGLVSQSALDNEFAGLATQVWPEVTRVLRTEGVITEEAHAGAGLLYAYGCLIGNTDMHHGNLAFLNTTGRPYEIAPAFDMLPMTFKPGSGGQIPNTVKPVPLHSAVSPSAWRRALGIAQNFLQRLRGDTSLSAEFMPCVTALEDHLQVMARKIALLA